MDCIAWTAEEIHEHRDLICHEELWYENYENALGASADGEFLWKRHEIDQITKADMQPVCHKETTKVDKRIIHPGFTAELRSRRLARKRRDRRRIISTLQQTTKKRFAEESKTSTRKIRTNLKTPTWR
jgi:hypothetical protein